MFLGEFSAAFRTATIKNKHKWLLRQCSFQKQLFAECLERIYENKCGGVILKWSCAKTQRTIIFQIMFCVSLSFGLRVSFIFLQGYRKILISMGENLSKIEITYFLPSFLSYLKLQILIVITCSKATKHVIVIFMSWSKPIVSQFSKLISQFKETWKVCHISLLNLAVWTRN